MSMHTCLNCGKTRKFDEYEFELKESATLKCPTCNAVFRIDAVMTDPGNKAGEEPLAAKEPVETPEEPAPEAEEPAADKKAPAGEEELDLAPQESAQPRGRVLSEAFQFGKDYSYDDAIDTLESIADHARRLSGLLAKGESKRDLERYRAICRLLSTPIDTLEELLARIDREPLPAPHTQGGTPTFEPVEENVNRVTAADLRVGDKVYVPTKSGEIIRKIKGIRRLHKTNSNDEQQIAITYVNYKGRVQPRIYVADAPFYVVESLKEEKEKTEWKGDFATFNAKLFGLAGNLDLPLEQVEVIIQELTDAGALTLSGDKVEIDLKKTRTVLVDFMHVEHEKAEIEAGTEETQVSAEPLPASEAAPEAQPVNLGTTPVSESEEDKNETEELEKRVARVVAKYFESVQLKEDDEDRIDSLDDRFYVEFEEGNPKGEFVVTDTNGEVKPKRFKDESDAVVYMDELEAEHGQSRKSGEAPPHEVTEYTDAETFIEFLQNTLIPDLINDEQEATAEDFETAIKYIEDHEAATDWESAEAFVGYLERTLVPDLEEAGKTETAKDFKTAIAFIEASQE